MTPGWGARRRSDRWTLTISTLWGVAALKFRVWPVDGQVMVFDVLVVATVAAAIWWWQRRGPVQARHARGRHGNLLLMPYEDLPPVGAFEPVPDESELDDYIADGVQQLARYLSGRDRTV